MAEANVVKIKQTVILDPARIGLVEDGARRDWVATVEAGTAVEDVLDSAFWAHKASQFSPFDHIEARAEDGSWIADLVVLRAGSNWAKVFMKAKYVLSTDESAITEADKHEVRWKGPHLMFAVVRLSDQQTVQDKFQTKEAAAIWMRSHEKAVG